MSENELDRIQAGARLKPVRQFRLHGGILALLYAGACFLVLLLASSQQTAPLARLELAGAALGMAGLVTMAIQFVTSGRFNFVSGHLGIDKIMTFHKVSALWVLSAIVLHPLFYVLPTALHDPALGLERLQAYLILPHYRSGVVSLAALAVLVSTSFLRDRLPWRYEIWRASHVVLGLTAVGAGLHHALSAGRFSSAWPVHIVWWLTGLAVLTILLVLYGWRWFRLHQRPWTVASVVQRADRLWEIDIQPQSGNPGLRYRAGQFVWITVGRHRMPLFDHPFSIADSPGRPGLSLIIKEVGDFTGSIGSLEPGTPVGIDGPYGEFILDDNETGCIVLLAGGVGIAPIMGLLRDMVSRHEKRPVRMAYAVGRPSNFACLEEIDAAREALDFKVVLVSEESAPDWNGDTGRIDSACLAQLLGSLDRTQACAYICGPGPMVTATSDALLDLGLKMDNIRYERFDYGGAASSRQDRRDLVRYLSVGAAIAAGIAVFARYL
ncbi:ferric reductase-like transmembrane domain-containing protein [Zhengella sp. ZM62]|uniref:ferredoxin reductase family protein n=1 Tax=Zhengella sedimenti TaxID=3390035 RepID=UPI0039756A12